MIQQDQWWTQAPPVNPQQAAPQSRQPAANDEWWASSPPVQQQATPARAPSPNLPTDVSSVMPALIAQESSGRPGVLGPMTRYGQAIGLTQMLPGTAREMAQRVGVPYDEGLLRGTTPEAAEYQRRLGEAYLQQGFEQTGNMRDALRYYHGGPNRDLWGPKTNAYAEEVLARLQDGRVAQVPSAPARQTATDPETGERVVLENGEWFPDPITNPRFDALRARARVEVGDPVTVQNADGVYVAENLLPQQMFNLRPGDRVQLANGEVVTLASQPYGDANIRPEDRQVGRVNLRESSVGDAVGAFATAGSEQIPLLDESVALTTGLLNGEGLSAMLQRQRDARVIQNQTNRDERIAGGIAGFATGFLAPGAGWVQGAQGANRILRAGLFGGGYSGLYGFGAEDGNAAERGQAALLAAPAGALTGGLLQGGADRLMRGSAAAAANPSPARRLSREGVTLTPGMMAENIGVIGPMLRGLEDGASGIPLMGPAIQQARNESVESLNRVAVNRALAPIGERLPKNVQPGYEAVDYTQRRLGAAYDEALEGVEARLDDGVLNDLVALTQRAQQELPDDMLAQFNRIVDQRVLRGSGDTVTGQQFKDIESELGNLARRYSRSSDVAQQNLGELITEVQASVRDLIARQYPDRAARIQAINSGYANLVRVEQAAGQGAAQGRLGVFTPGELSNAVAQMTGRSARGANRGLMQDLSANARTVLPNTVGDSGTATRGAVTGLLAGLSTGMVPVTAPVAVPIIASSVLYSKPAQGLLNVIYRAADNPGQAQRALAELSQLAARSPQLAPYYEDALRRVLLASPSQTPATGPAALGQPAPMVP